MSTLPGWMNAPVVSDIARHPERRVHLERAFDCAYDKWMAWRDDELEGETADEWIERAIAGTSASYFRVARAVVYAAMDVAYGSGEPLYVDREVCSRCGARRPIGLYKGPGQTIYQTCEYCREKKRLAREERNVA